MRFWCSFVYSYIYFNGSHVSLFGKHGLIAWVAMGTIIANIQVIKTVHIFGISATLGNVMFASIYLATDILNDIYGRKVAKRAVWLGFLQH